MTRVASAAQSTATDRGRSGLPGNASPALAAGPQHKLEALPLDATGHVGPGLRAETMPPTLDQRTLTNSLLHGGSSISRRRGRMVVSPPGARKPRNGDCHLFPRWTGKGLCATPLSGPSRGRDPTLHLPQLRGSLRDRGRQRRASRPLPLLPLPLRRAQPAARRSGDPASGLSATGDPASGLPAAGDPASGLPASGLPSWDSASRLPASRHATSRAPASRLPTS